SRCAPSAPTSSRSASTCGRRRRTCRSPASSRPTSSPPPRPRRWRWAFPTSSRARWCARATTPTGNAISSSPSATASARAASERRPKATQMIPYFDGHLFNIGSQPIYMFGVLVALGVIIGDRIVVKEGAKRGLDPQDVKFLNVRIVFGGFIMAHLVSVIFYFPERIRETPWVLLYIWSGLSSFGGFLGAALAFLYYTRKDKIPALPYADSVALGLAVGWIFGRTGCFTAHDHPGLHTSFFLAVRYPDGPRHDLGLDELLFTIVMTIILFLYARRPRVPGR